MIILDTNVLCEFMKPLPEPKVVLWLRNQPSASLFTTSITQAEIHYGICLLPEGKRRTALQDAAAEMFREDFAGRILAFGCQEARLYAELAAERRSLGKPISQSDAQIAAIARSSGARLATRNVVDFEECGLEILNPWSDPRL